jgi:hypothetical protein
MVLTISGGMVALTGNYQSEGGCHASSGGGSTRETLEVSGNQWHYDSADYSSGDCTGVAVDSSSIDATIVVAGTAAITGWVDSSEAPEVAPPALDGSGPLSDTESYTNLTLTITAVVNNAGISVGDTADIYYIVDDTGATGLKLWRDKTATKAVISDPWFSF